MRMSETSPKASSAPAPRDTGMGQIPRSERSKGLGIFRAVFNRLINMLARALPMFPAMRVFLHRLRGVTIGKRVFVGIDVLIDDADPWGVVIEDDVTVLARAILLAHAYYPRHLQKILAEASGKRGLTLKQGAYVGVGAILLPGVTVGEYAIVGAGSVVTEDVPPYSVAVGSPARIIRQFGKEEVSEIE